MTAHVALYLPEKFHFAVSVDMHSNQMNDVREEAHHDDVP
jgi:hypothetical protein